MAYDEKKGKVMKIFEDYGVLIFICVLRAPYYQGDALSELVKCKSSKNIFQTNFPKNPDISAYLSGFQRRLPDMSSP
jgi:hypothetical protein